MELFRFLLGCALAVLLLAIVASVLEHAVFALTSLPAGAR